MPATSTVTKIQVDESEFGGIHVDKTTKNARLSSAKLTRDAFLYGGLENAILARIEQARKQGECTILTGCFDARR